MTGWNLPPGCTDADIDRAACGDGSEAQCDSCGKIFLLDDLHHAERPNEPWDGLVCDSCKVASEAKKIA